MPPIAQLVADWGYLALFVGTFFEGETIVVVAGYLAHAGYLGVEGVILASFAGTLAGDQLYFHIGRTHGAAFLARRPAWRPRLERAERLIHRHQDLVMLGFRFTYGLRTVTPFALGAARISPLRYLFFNVVTALAWAILFTLLGVYFGQAVEYLLERIHDVELLVAGLIVAVGLAVWVVQIVRSRRRRQAGP